LDWQKLSLDLSGTNDNANGNSLKTLDSVTFEFHEDRHAELCRRVEVQAKDTGRGTFEMKCPAHNGKGNSSLFYDPATRKAACIKKPNPCSYFDILAAFNLPNAKLPSRETKVKTKEEKISQTNQILSLAGGLELFHTGDGTAFVSIVVGEHKEIHPVNSKSFREYLSYQFYKTNGKSPSLRHCKARSTH
jgi:hypothetical protein